MENNDIGYRLDQLEEKMNHAERMLEEIVEFIGVLSKSIKELKNEQVPSPEAGNPQDNSPVHSEDGSAKV